MKCTYLFKVVVVAIQVQEKEYTIWLSVTADRQKNRTETVMRILEYS
jgi:hypothetical protein